MFNVGCRENDAIVLLHWRGKISYIHVLKASSGSKSKVLCETDTSRLVNYCQYYALGDPTTFDRTILWAEITAIRIDNDNTFSAMIATTISSSKYVARARQQDVLIYQYEYLSPSQYNIAFTRWSQTLPSIVIYQKIPIRNTEAIWYY